MSPCDRRAFLVQASTGAGVLDIVAADAQLFAKIGEDAGFGIPVFGIGYNANGFVDVINLNTGQPFRQPIRVPGAAVLCHYWRQ